MSSRTPSPLGTAFTLLAEIIPFDSALLLRTTPGQRPEVIFSTGYSANSTWALAHMFPESLLGRYRYGTGDGASLPPTISTSTLSAEFTNSTLFREHLSAEGYVEGMTVEIISPGGTAGLAHFSSRTRRAFEGRPRQAALAVSGLLGHLLELWPLIDENQPTPATDEHLTAPLRRDPSFERHLDNFRRSPLAYVDHLWFIGREPVRVTLVTPRQITAQAAEPDELYGLSRQEIQVLSVLCCGASDAEIAKRLYISARTVQTHVGALRRKLNASSRLEAVIIALGAGLYVPDPDWAPLHQIVRGRPGTHTGSAG